MRRFHLEPPLQCRPYKVGMHHWIGLAGTMKRRRGERIKSVISQFQAWMLARDIKPRRFSNGRQGASDGAQLDCFGTRSDDQRNTILTQLPPWLRRQLLRRCQPEGQEFLSIVLEKLWTSRMTLAQPFVSGG